MTDKGIQKIIALSLNEDAFYFRDRTCDRSPDFISHLQLSTHLPRRVTREELVGAVSMVCDASNLAPPEVAIDRWDDYALPARI